MYHFVHHYITIIFSWVVGRLLSIATILKCPRSICSARAHWSVRQTKATAKKAHLSIAKAVGTVAGVIALRRPIACGGARIGRHYEMHE